MTWRFNAFLLALLLIVGGPAWWLLVDSSARDVTAQHLDIGQLRDLANAMPGQKPAGVEIEIVAWNSLPGDLLAAGSGLRRRLIGTSAFRLAVPGKGPVIIETGLAPEVKDHWSTEDHWGMLQRDPAAQFRIDASMRAASLILATHEHPDHLGGLAVLAGRPGGSDALAHAALNPGQLPAAPRSALLPWPAGLKLKAVLNGRTLQAVAPGVVVIPAPSHTPGSQMIFVQLANREEYLFTGDIASLAVNWRELRPRARLLSDYHNPEDRGAVLGWLRAIADLKRAAPGLHVIPSHDPDWLNDPLNHAGVLVPASGPYAKLTGT